MKAQRKNIWFTADTHWGHANVIKYCDRPFKDLDEMHEKMTKNWNSVVRPEDTVIIVGDFSMYLKKPELKQILSLLNGTKVLVMGNHDSFTESEWIGIGFSFVCRSMTMKIAGEIVNISHYPYKRRWYFYTFYNIMSKIFPSKFWKPRVFSNQLEDDGKFLLHGHIHSKRTRYIKDKKMIHVGCDAHGFKPVSLQKIANIISSIKENRYKDEEIEDEKFHE